VDSEFDAAIRSDLRRLGRLLGPSLIRQEGQHLLELVEEVRGLARTDCDAAAKRVGCQ
jgi:phosphoenolpyruvate carboxylase